MGSSDSAVAKPAAVTSATVVIPAYNEAANIARLSHQILDQLWTDTLVLDQLVIVDDCSSDNTSVVAEQLASESERVHVIRHTERRGKNAGLRDGIAACQSDVVVFIDADVSLDAHCLTSTIQLLADDPSLGASSCLSIPLPAREWRERASRFQALFVVEMSRLGQGALLRLFALRVSAIHDLTLPDDTHDDIYIGRWLIVHGSHYAVCTNAATYFRSATGLRDFAKQTLRGWISAATVDRLLPLKEPPTNTRGASLRALIRSIGMDPLGFLLYVAWRGIVMATPARWWLPVVDLSRHDQSISTKDATL